MTLFRAPLSERIELAVKRVADARSNIEYHRYMCDFFYQERTKITPQTSAANAYEYARLFEQQEFHAQDKIAAERKYNEAAAKLAALRKSNA